MRITLGFTFAMVLAMIFVAMAEANTIGITYNKVAEDTGWGAIANLNGTIADTLNTELDVQLQGGDVIKGRYALEVGYKSLIVFQNGNIKGYRLDGLGNELDLGLKTQVKVGQLDVAVGVFGRNASEFAIPTAESVLLENGFAADALPEGLADIAPAPSGLRIYAGRNLNLLLSTELEVDRWDVGIRVLPQLTGEIKAHQALLTAQTDVALTENIDLNLGGEVAFQSVDGVLEYETAGIATLNLEF